MTGFIKLMFIVLLLVLLCFSGSLAIKYISMNDQACLVRPTLIDLNLDELHYQPFIISMIRYKGSCNTVEDLFGRICGSRYSRMDQVQFVEDSL